MDQTNYSDLFPGQLDEQLKEILVGYTLGALEPDEMLAVDEYLQEHPELTTTISRLEDSVAGLAYAAPQFAAPVGAKATLLARVHADLPDAVATPTGQAPTEIASGASRATTFPWAVRSESQTHPSVAPRRSRPQRGQPRRRRWSFDNLFDFATGWKVATIASCAALLFFVISTIQLTGALSQTTSKLAGTQADLDRSTTALDRAEQALADVSNQLTDNSAALATLRQEVSDLQAENQELAALNQLVTLDAQSQREELASLLNVNQVVALGATGEMPGARGTLFVGEDSLILVLRGLQPLPAGQTYELWLIPADDNPVPAGLVAIDSTDATKFTTDVTLSTTSFAAVGLSIEPAGGSPQPTGPIVLLGERTT
ncbi:MAG: anti-sigma factor [Caldilineaceae bacterium]